MVPTQRKLVKAKIENGQQINILNVCGGFDKADEAVTPGVLSCSTSLWQRVGLNAKHRGKIEVISGKDAAHAPRK